MITENCADRYYSKVIQTFTVIIKRQFANCQTLLVNTACALKFLEDYTDTQAQSWQVQQKYYELPDQLDDIHLHFEQFKSAIQTDFSHLKEASSKNTQNLQSTLSLHQAYTSTLSSHITTVCSKIAELQQQIQQHCMYPHNKEPQHMDEIQLEAPEYDPDIDREKDLHTGNRHATVSVNSILEDDHSIPDLIDDRSTNPDTTTYHQAPIQTNWPDAPTIQILCVSLTTTDLPPEVTYYRRTTVYTADGEEIPEIVEENEEEQEYSLGINNLITHHNTHQESE